MMRPAILAALAFVAACARGPDPEPKRPAIAPQVCAIGPDDGPLIADRGIGGTGARPAAQIEIADRGIGGTGIVGTGIVGTGIVGVITGFASVCLNGREVALADAVPVLVDGQPAAPGALRAGQVAVVEARGAGSDLAASRIGVRHEVIGPVDRVEAGGAVIVAGQTVAVSAQTRRGAAPVPTLTQGDWIAVSGIRNSAGVIEATRLDLAPQGLVLVHGVLRRAGAGYRIGALPLRLAPGLAPTDRPATATGRMRDGALWVESIVPDQLTEDPAGYFGPAYPVLLLEGYVAGANGRIRFGDRLDVLADGAALYGPSGFAPRRAVIEFRRRPDGGLQAVGLREPGPALQPLGAPGLGAGLMQGRPGGAEAARPQKLEPAPMPSRAMREGPGRDGPGRDAAGPGSGRGQGAGPGGPPGGGQPGGTGPRR